MGFGDAVEFYKASDRDEFDFSLIWYLSGPMTGYPRYNFDTFEHVSKKLDDAGIMIQSPHWNLVPQGLEGEQLWMHMMVECNKQMLNCHGLILMKGWPQSSGSCRELGWAIERKLPVWYISEDLVLHNFNRVIGNVN